MDNLQAGKIVFDHNTFRIGALFWLAVCNDGTCLPDELKEAIEDYDVLGAVGDVPDYVDTNDVETVCEWLLDERKLGFLARVDTPVPQNPIDKRGGYTSYGWGFYASHWVYAETLELVLTEAERVSKEYIARRLEHLRTKSA